MFFSTGYGASGANSGFNPAVPPPVVTAQIPATLIQGVYQQPQQQQYSAQFGVAPYGTTPYSRPPPALMTNPFRHSGYRPFHERRGVSSFGSDYHQRRLEHRDRESSES